MKPLCVLVVNRCMGTRTGTEMYVRDLATALLSRGHRPMVFSPQVGPLAEELRAERITVVDRLKALDMVPDIIHGHHTWETMAAIARFPDIPAIFVGHDATAWHDTPPRLPQIGRYVAVDHTLRDRFIDRHGIHLDQVTVVANPINFDRFCNRGPLPRRPRRALQISGYSGLSERAEIEAACVAREIHLDSVGQHFGNATTKPETLLADYDLVFAKGRCAFEAAAAGTAVVVCDTWGCGPMLSSRFLDTAHGILAGRNMMSETLCRATLLQRIDEYDPDDAAKVSWRIRQTFDAESVADRFVEIYREVILNHQPIDPDRSKQAFGDEILWWSVHLERVLHEHATSAARLQPRKRARCEPIARGSTIDFDHPFRGGGWHPAERDDRGVFCWLGPEPWAWVELVVPSGDSLALQCEIAYVLDPAVLEKLVVRIDGHPIKFEVTTRESTLQISGSISKAVPLQTAETAHLMFSVPRTVRPHDLDPANDDMRPLGIALRRISLELPTPRIGAKAANRVGHTPISGDAA